MVSHSAAEGPGRVMNYWAALRKDFRGAIKPSVDGGCLWVEPASGRLISASRRNPVARERDLWRDRPARGWNAQRRTEFWRDAKTDRPEACSTQNQGSA